MARAMRICARKLRSPAQRASASAAASATREASKPVLRDHLLEPWHLWRLETGSPDEKTRAARKLARIRSRRAVAPLLEILEAGARGNNSNLGDHYAAKALIEIGPAAVRPVIARVAILPGDSASWWGILRGFGRDAVPAFIDVLQTGSAKERALACELLERFAAADERALGAV